MLLKIKGGEYPMKRTAKLLVTLIFCLGVAFTAMTPAFAAIAQVKGVKAQVTYNTATLSWSKASGVSGYEVQQYTSKKWKAVTTTKSLKYTVKKLKTGTTYKFRVVGYKTSGKKKTYGKASSAVSVKPVCVAPTSLSAVQTSSTAVKLSWKKVSGATGYTVQQYKNEKWVTVGKNVKKTYFSVSKLTPDTKVKFRVCAYTTVSKKNISGAYSKTVSIKPKVVVPSSLALSSASSSAVTLTWGKVSGASGYTVYSYSGSKYTKVADVTTNKCTVKNLKANTSYKYAVKAYIKSGSKVYSSTYTSAFSVKTAPAAVTGLEVTSAKDVSVALKWKAASGAAGYEVYVLKSGKWALAGTTTGTTYTVKGLSNLTEYSFKVRAYSVFSKKNLYSGYSSAVKTKTIFPAVGTLRIDNAFDDSFLFSWGKVAQATSYIIEKSSDNKTWTSVDFDGAFDVETADRIYCTVKELTNSSVVYVRVTGVNADGVLGVSSSFAGKTAPAMVTDVKAVSGNDAKSAVISWPALKGADGYVVERIDNGKTMEVKTNLCTFTGLSPNKSYNFRVRAFVEAENGRAFGSESELVYVKTYLSPVTGFKVVTNANYGNYHSFTWNSQSGMNYVLEYYNYGSGEWVKADVSHYTNGYFFKFDEDYLGDVKNVKFKKTSNYVTTVSWDPVYSASEYTVSISAAENSDVMIEQVTTKSNSVALRLPPQTKISFEIESFGVPCRIYGIDANGDRTGCATATVNVVSSTSGTATTKPTYTTPNAPAFSSSNDESRLLYTLKLVQAINNTKYAKGTVEAVRKDVYETKFREGSVGGTSIDIMLAIMEVTDPKGAKELKASLESDSDSTATATFKNGVGTVKLKEKDFETGKYVSSTQKYARLYNFVTPVGEDYASFYKQNDDISTFSKKVKSVSVSGNTIKLVLRPETVKLVGKKASSALNVHEGIIGNGGIESVSMGGDSTSTYKAGMNLTKDGSKFVENKPGTTITAVLNNDYTLKSLSITNPYILKTNGSIETDIGSSKIYLLVDGAVKANYTFTYK